MLAIGYCPACDKAVYRTFKAKTIHKRQWGIGSAAYQCVGDVVQSHGFPYRVRTWAHPGEFVTLIQIKPVARQLGRRSAPTLPVNPNILSDKARALMAILASSRHSVE